jgi:hypothetical protein
MMRALVLREAERMAGSAGFGAALWTHASWLAAFLAVWGGGGVPLVPGMPVYEQLRLVQSMLMIVLLPWTAARVIPSERGDAIVRTAACLGVRPSRMLAARIVALSATLLSVVAAGLPMAVVACRMSDVSVSRLLVDQGAVAATAIVMATLVAALQQTLASRVAVWFAATAVSGVLAWSVRAVALPSATIGPAFALAALVGAMLLAARGDVSLRYVSEKTA